MAEIDEQVSEFVQLSERERELKAELKEVSAQRIALEAAILQHWQDQGIEKARVKGLTLYPDTRVYASAPREAVEAAGLHDLVGVSSASFSAWYREWEASGDPLPEPLVDQINVFRKTTLRTRKGF
jgi:hypothetical protein